MYMCVVLSVCICVYVSVDRHLGGLHGADEQRIRWYQFFCLHVEFVFIL